MQQIINYIIDNYFWLWPLIFILVSIVEFILLFIFKKDKIIDNSLIAQLTDFIFSAEKKFKNGSDKMSFVLTEAKRILGDFYNEKDVRTLVEWLLTLPQKKGVK